MYIHSRLTPAPQGEQEARRNRAAEAGPSSSFCFNIEHIQPARLTPKERMARASSARRLHAIPYSPCLHHYPRNE